MSTIFTLALSGARAAVAVGIEIPHGPVVETLMEQKGESSISE